MQRNLARVLPAFVSGRAVEVRGGGSRRGALVSPAPCGLWHVLPSIGVSASNAWHLAIPALAHLATNSAGVLIAWWLVSCH